MPFLASIPVPTVIFPWITTREGATRRRDQRGRGLPRARGGLFSARGGLRGARRAMEAHPDDVAAWGIDAMDTKEVTVAGVLFWCRADAHVVAVYHRAIRAAAIPPLWPNHNPDERVTRALLESVAVPEQVDASLVGSQSGTLPALMAREGRDCIRTFLCHCLQSFSVYCSLQD